MSKGEEFATECLASFEYLFCPRCRENIYSEEIVFSLETGDRVDCPYCFLEFTLDELVKYYDDILNE